jgi:hypothetical protein
MQEEFLAALRGQREVLGRSGASALLAPPRGTTEGRWRIYRDGYLIRLAEAIENDYAAIKRILGDGAFASLCSRYLAAFPPSSHDIGRSGVNLPEFLVTDALTSDLPFLPDLARFEWAMTEAVVAPDSPTCRSDTLVELAPELLLDLVISPCPGSVVIRSEWPLGDLWACRDKEDREISVDVIDRPSRILVFRRGLSVQWRAASKEEARFLESVSGGATLAELGESPQFNAGEESASGLVSLFLGMIESSIVQVRFPETPSSVSSKGESS